MKFGILVLIDLGGTCFYRASKPGERVDSVKPDFTQKGKAVYFRPGVDKLLNKLASHPRVSLSFYSSIMRQNIQPIMHKLLESKRLTKGLQQKIGIFDQEFNSPMIENWLMERLMEKRWDTYRDLEKVFADPWCKKQGFNLTNTLLVDSDAKKIQLYIPNAIQTKAYTFSDVFNEEEEEQMAYMKQLGDQIVKVVEKCQETIPDSLQENLEDQFKPEILIKNLHKKRYPKEDKDEETKEENSPTKN